MRRGLLFVVSAPSGTGKTTLVERLVEVVPNLAESRSCTSRPMRPGERQGIDYNFMSAPEFEAMAARNEFLEWTSLFGQSYGTGDTDTERHLSSGRDLVLVIDIHGARQVRHVRSGTPAIFVLPPSLEILERRLRGRSKDSEAQIRHRLDVARSEVAAFSEYDYLVVNDEFQTCVDRMCSIVTAERSRLHAMQSAAERISKTFEQPMSRGNPSTSVAGRKER